MKKFFLNPFVLIGLAIAATAVIIAVARLVSQTIKDDARIGNPGETPNEKTNREVCEDGCTEAWDTCVSGSNDLVWDAMCGRAWDGCNSRCSNIKDRVGFSSPPPPALYTPYIPPRDINTPRPTTQPTPPPIPPRDIPTPKG